MKYSEKVYTGALKALATLRQSVTDREKATIDFIVEAITEKGDRECQNTNADRIRAMGDEELAEFAILNTKFFCTKEYEKVCEKPMSCTECAKDWLTQTAEGE